MIDTKFRESRIHAAAVVLIALAACAGGSHGWESAQSNLPNTPPSAPAPAPASTLAPSSAPAPIPSGADSSAACVNEADFHEGTTLVSEQDFTAINNDVSKITVTVVVQARESFAGANPVRFLISRLNHGDNVAVLYRLYKDLVDGKVVEYGSRIGPYGSDSLITYEPPATIAASMTPGQSMQLSAVAKSELPMPDGGVRRGKTTIDVTNTYVGRESLVTPMGTFNTCKFLRARRMQQPDGTSKPVLDIEDWIAAEGPFRGQSLKIIVARNSEDLAQAGTYVVTSMTYSAK